MVESVFLASSIAALLLLVPVTIAIVRGDLTYQAPQRTAPNGSGQVSLDGPAVVERLLNRALERGSPLAHEALARSLDPRAWLPLVLLGLVLVVVLWVLEVGAVVAALFALVVTLVLLTGASAVVKAAGYGSAWVALVCSLAIGVILLAAVGSVLTPEFGEAVDFLSDR